MLCSVILTRLTAVPITPELESGTFLMELKWELGDQTLLRTFCTETETKVLYVSTAVVILQKEDFSDVKYQTLTMSYRLSTLILVHHCIMQ